MSLLAVFVALVFLHSLVSARLERTALTPPIVFTLAGLAILALLPDLSWAEGRRGVFLHVAEVGLVLLLFTDASRTDLAALRRVHGLPLRLLGPGMLLTILLGALAALLVFPGFSLWEAGMLAAILAPTDAGLGQIVVNSPKVPARIRRALNVEAGLNDGLSVPFLLFFMALASTSEAAREANLARFAVEQLGYGTLIGVAVGLCGGWLLALAARRGWMADTSRQLAVVALPLTCLLASEAAGASMFIAAFVAGLVVQVNFRDAGTHSVEFAEEWGRILNLAVFFMFGLLVARDGRLFTLPHVLYALLSLTVVRVLPVALALAGTRLCRATVLFMGWFGPRGLASIVLGLVYLEQGPPEPEEATIRLTVMVTVLLSILLHGASALPGLALYARRVATLDAHAPENRSA
jgi:NhaP-type Na+/H+ or K+/H+ antiporter